MRATVFSKAVALAFFSSACATLPTDAPPAVKRAHASLAQAREVDAGLIAPRTMAKATEAYDEALFQLDAGDAREAVRKADEARKLAESAVAMRKDVTAWDRGLGRKPKRRAH